MDLRVLYWRWRGAVFTGQVREVRKKSEFETDCILMNTQERTRGVRFSRFNLSKAGIAMAVATALIGVLFISGCQRSRYEMGKKIKEPSDAPAYTQKANFQPPAPTDSR